MWSFLNSLTRSLRSTVDVSSSAQTEEEPPVGVSVCPYCNDPDPTQQLPCCHSACGVCLADLLQEEPVVCRVVVGDTDMVCGTPFTRESVTDVQQQHKVEEGMCPNHPTQPLSLVCTTCSQQLCKQCTHDEKHTTVKLGTFRKDLRTRLQQLVEQLVEDVATLDTLSTALWKHKGATLHSISDEDQRQQANKAIEADMKAIQLKRDQLVVHREHLHLAHTLTRMQQLDKQSINRQLPVLHRNVHTLFPSINLNRFARDYTQINQPKMVFGGKGSGTGKLDHLRSIVVVNQHQQQYQDNVIILVGDDNQDVQVFSQLGQRERYLATNLGSAVTGIAVAPDSNHVWLCLYGKKILQLCDITTGALVRSIQLDHMAWGITVLPDESLIMSFHRLRKVCRLSPDGVEQWSSAGNGNIEYNLCGIAVAEDEVFVCDWGNHQLQVLNVHNGRFIRTIGGSEQMDHPSDVTWDARAKVLLVGERDKVSVWSRDGRRIHTWGTYGNKQGQFQDVNGICVSSMDGSVWVVDNWNPRIQVF